MNNNNIKKVHYYISLLNEHFGIIPKEDKKSYLKLIKPYKKYTKTLHLLPKTDITLILKNKFDYNENKDNINKIVKKHYDKLNKVKSHYLEKRKKSCKRYYGNTKARLKEDLLLKTLNKKSKKRTFIIRQRGRIKNNCKGFN